MAYEWDKIVPTAADVFLGSDECGGKDLRLRVMVSQAIADLAEYSVYSFPFADKLDEIKRIFPEEKGYVVKMLRCANVMVYIPMPMLPPDVAERIRRRADKT